MLHRGENMRPKVLYTYPTKKIGMDMVREVADIKVLKEGYGAEIPEEEFIEEIRDSDALINVRATPTPRKIIAEGRNLKIIARHGVGFDCVDIKAATEHNVLVTVAMREPYTVAEHTVGFIIALSRNFIQATTSIKSGKWETEKMMGAELRNKTLGIIGLGAIGVAVAEMMGPFKMKMIGYDPYISQEKAKEMGVQLIDLPTLLKESDYLTIHTPLTKETQGMIGEEEFNLMKDGVYVINCARGRIIKESALYNALKEGKVAGAALDVLMEEPPSRNNPLFKLDNMLFTPHVAGVTHESAEKLAKSVAEDVISVLKGGLPRREKIVNKELLIKREGKCFY